MFTLEEIVMKLKLRRLPVVAEAVEMHVNSLRLIENGTKKNPSYSTMKKLSDYLQRDDT